MQAIQNINLLSLLDTFISVAAAFILGSVIGLERQIRQRTAGLRTNTLVAVGAAVFVDMAYRLDGSGGAVRVVAYVVSGIGFLGAGAIMKEGANITGLNTAATLWGSAAVGACAGADLLGEALIAALFVLASNTLLRPVVNRINRQPISEEAGEATYVVRVICSRAARPEVLDQLLLLLEAANYPVRDVDQHPFGPTDTEIGATLYATAVEPEELDRVIEDLEALDGVQQAFWNAAAEE
jgi:putative Mg2+ transporter-C (MgtC) family protein